MYEQYLAAFKNGVKEISISIEQDELRQSDMDDDVQPVQEPTSVTVTFAVTTDTEAWITITGDGFVYPAFGGTGTRRKELDQYAEQAVQIWRSITGDEKTTCRYKLSDSANSTQMDSEYVIKA